MQGNMKSSLKEKWIVCRVCLKQPKAETMQAIFDDNDENDLTRMILVCGGVPIKQYDHYPDKICSKCLRYLQAAHKFRLTCQRSHKHLSRFIAPVEVEDTKVDPIMEQLENETLQDADEDYADDEEVDEDIAGETADELLPKDDTEDLALVKDEPSEVDTSELVEVFEPLDEEDEAMIAELEAIDMAQRTAECAEPIEYIDDFVDEDEEPAEEEFIASPQPSPVRWSKLSLKTKGKPARKPRNKPGKGKRGTAVRQRDAKVKHSTYICDICGNIYPSQGRLTEHIKLHKGIKPHECEICGHAFAQTQQLTRHMNTHTGHRPYKCQYCPAAFADLSTRNKHHRIHTNERPYVCDVCGKSFTYTNTLKFHKMIHTGEKPHVCNICGKGFQQAYKLRNHKATHEKKSAKSERIALEEESQGHLDVPLAYQERTAVTAELLEI